MATREGRSGSRQATPGGRAASQRARPSGNGAEPDGSGPAAPELLSIGRLAKLSGVSSRTIRYYEELGIVPAPQRSSGGTRKYPRGYRFYIEGALALKELGFSLEEIRLVGRIALGEERREGERDRAAMLVREKMRRLEHRIRVLNRLRDVLQGQRGGERAAGREFVDLLEMARGDGSAL